MRLLPLLVVFGVLFFSAATAAPSSGNGRLMGSEARWPKDFGRWMVEEGPFDAWLATRDEVAKAKGPKAVDSELLRKSLHTLKERAQAEGQPLRPVLIVPSLIGSVIEGQLHDFQSQHWYCWRNWDSWYYMWFMDTTQMVPYLINCWFEAMSLSLDNSTGYLKDAKGVSTRIVDYGGVGGVSYLDQSKTMGVWNQTIEIFTELGWEVGKNFRAAPYDWRFSPIDYMANDFPKLKQLIEEMYESNNESRVAAISLSMGGPYFLSFLNHFVDQQWKDTYIESWTSFDGAFGGSVEAAVMSLTSRPGWASYFDTTALKRLLRTFGSMLWMLPWEQALGSDHVVVKTLTRSYTTAQLHELLIDAGAHDAAEVYASMKAKGLLNFQPPGVATYVFYGDSLNTTLSFALNVTQFSDDANPPPQLTVSDGDGVVPLKGLRMFDAWQDKQKQPISFYAFPGLVHGGTVHDIDALRMFVEIVLGAPPPSQG